MKLWLYKTLLMVLLLHRCQGQDPALPSPSPESDLPSLDDVMDAVKAALFEVVNISKDDAARAVFAQAVEELGPQENMEETPQATADDTEDRLHAVVHEDTDKETTRLSEENAKQEQAEPDLNSSEQTLGLLDEEEVRQRDELSQEPGEKPEESFYQLNISDEESLLDGSRKDPVSSLAQDPVESLQEPKESELKSEDLIQKELNESQVWLFDSAPEEEQEEQAGVDEGIQEQVESQVIEAQDQTPDNEMVKMHERKIDMEDNIESEIQKGELFDLVEQTEPQPDRGLVTDDELKVVGKEQTEDEERTLDDENEDVKGEPAAQASVEGEVEMEGLNSKLVTDTMEETNVLNDIETSRDPVLNWEVPTLGPIGGRALPPFPTLAIDLGESDELVEEPADKTQSTTPKQEAWKIGVIAVAFFLILQTLVTVTYILKCRRKRNSRSVPESVCEHGTAEHDAANPDEQTRADDLPEHSQIQQETLALTPIHTQSASEKSFNPQN